MSDKVCFANKEMERAIRLAHFFSPGPPSSKIFRARVDKARDGSTVITGFYSFDFDGDSFNSKEKPMKEQKDKGVDNGIDNI